MGRLKRTNSGLIFAVFLLSLFDTGISQISEGGLPISYNRSEQKSVANIPAFKTEVLDIEQLLQEDRELSIDNRFAVFQDVKIDLKADGTELPLPEEEGSFWRYRILSANALSMQVFFDRFLIPPGAKLFLYSQDFETIYGAFTERNNNSRNALMIADFPGNELIVEYFEPSEALFPGELQIGAIGRSYRDMNSSSRSLDENGYVNINCPEGEPWQLEKHAVSRITYRIGAGSFTCTGALINNVNNDGTPYYLTAHHCIDASVTESSITLYFNDEYFGCTETLRNRRTLSGASILTTGEASDYTLLLLDNPPPLDYQPYYAGWDASGDSGQNATGIHHPGGLRKKISFDYDPPENYPFPINWEDDVTTPANTHWQVIFDLSNTAGGSSGSPIFNDQKRIIGQLHGGNEFVKYYGRLDYSWFDADRGYSSSLGAYLDPGQTGTLVLDGYLPEGVTPDPQYYPEFEDVCIDAPVRLKGFSAFDVDTWSWSFSPDDVVFEEGFDAGSPEPLVRFPSSGAYDVTLAATNTFGTETGSFPATVNASGNIFIDVFPQQLADSCLCSSDSILLKAGGATAFSWELDPLVTGIFSAEDDSLSRTATFSFISKPDTAINLAVRVKGLHGSCADSVDYVLPLLSQPNDSIHKAQVIGIGKTPPVSNRCARIEFGEPVPPFGDCTGQLSWCDEFGSGLDIIANSVWFIFAPDSSGDYSISSSGMDNQIAIYESVSSEELLAGNYTLLGANDDITPFNFNAKITRVSLEAGKIYFIQVDGSAGNVEGSFRLTIEAIPGVSTGPEMEAAGLQVYPQPAGERLTIRDEDFRNGKDITVEIYHISGRLVHSESYESVLSDRIEVALQNLSPGMYLLRLNHGAELITRTMLKQ